MVHTFEMRLADIERRLAVVEEFKRRIDNAQIPNLLRQISQAITNLTNNDKFLKKEMVDLHIQSAVNTDFITQLQDEMFKVMEAYYKVFPEREAQDEKFRKQLENLNPPKKPHSKD